MSAGAQLSSVSTALNEMTHRVTEIADSLADTDRDDVAAVLYEVERSLTNATRRLEKAVDALR
jgi:methyl-accepting chemotaxis protein